MHQIVIRNDHPGGKIEEKFNIKDGPLYSTLESSLQEFNVKRQAYQGGTFVGDHVHKLHLKNSHRIFCSC